MKLIAQGFRNLWLEIIVAVAVMFGLPIYFALTNIYYDDHVEVKSQSLKNLANSVASAMLQNLKERSREVQLLAQMPSFVSAPLNSNGIQDTLDSVQKSYPLYSWIGVADAKGMVHAATKNMLVGQSVSARPWFQKAQDGTYIGDLHEAKMLADLINMPLKDSPLRFIDFAAPIKDTQGSVRGVLGAHVHWAWADDLVQSFTPEGANASGIEILLVNRENEIIFPATSKNVAANSALPAVGPTTSARFINWGDKPYLTAVSKVGNPNEKTDLGWRVYVRQPKTVVIGQVIALEKTVLLIFAAAGLAFGFLTWWLGKRWGHPG